MLQLIDENANDGKWFYVNYRTDTDYSSSIAKVFTQTKADAVTLLRNRLGKIAIYQIDT